MRIYGNPWTIHHLRPWDKICYHNWALPHLTLQMEWKMFYNQTPCSNSEHMWNSQDQHKHGKGWQTLDQIQGEVPTDRSWRNKTDGTVLYGQENPPLRSRLMIHVTWGADFWKKPIKCCSVSPLLSQRGVLSRHTQEPTCHSDCSDGLGTEKLAEPGLWFLLCSLDNLITGEQKTVCQPDFRSAATGSSDLHWRCVPSLSAT